MLRDVMAPGDIFVDSPSLPGLCAVRKLPALQVVDSDNRLFRLPKKEKAGKDVASPAVQSLSFAFICESA
jgi:hypothetical protein